MQHEDTTLPLRAVAPPDSFLLVAGEADQAWCDATTKAVAERGVKLTAIRVGYVDGDWLDPGLAFVRSASTDRRALSWSDQIASSRDAAWPLPSTPDAAIAAALDQVLHRF